VNLFFLLMKGTKIKSHSQLAAGVADMGLAGKKQPRWGLNILGGEKEELLALTLDPTFITSIKKQ